MMIMAIMGMMESILKMEIKVSMMIRLAIRKEVTNRNIVMLNLKATAH